MSKTGQRSRLKPNCRSIWPVSLAVTLDEFGIAFVAQCLRVGRLLADQPQSRNTPAFLIDRDERLNVREVAQVVDQFAELSGASECSGRTK
jgi:hypothetical protein